MSMTTTKANTKKSFKSIQDKIFQIVNQTPGIRYRELLRTAKMSNGVLSYHLTILNNSRKIRVNKINNRVTRYFSRDISPLESNLIGLLRQSTTRKIIVYILEHEPCTFNDIVNHTKKVPSTVSWHLTKIKDANIVKVKQNQHTYYYDIKLDKFRFKKLLIKYKNSLQKNH
jgi:predicted transcriptional regulator